MGLAAREEGCREAYLVDPWVSAITIISYSGVSIENVVVPQVLRALSASPPSP